jgi:ParB/RepB/Spo0J family partition protein
MNKKIETIGLAKLSGHPLNRKFDTKGDAWKEFEASVKLHGVVEPLLVRPHGGKGLYQILAGHRRYLAAERCGHADVPCQVEAMDDRDALLYLVNSNLQRENPNIVEEARLVLALGSELGMETDEICEHLSRDAEWVGARQMVFSFGDEVVAALEAAEESKRLSEGAFREILKAPLALREKAMALVLNGEDHDEPLSEQRAREYIQFSLIPDWEDEQKWEAGMEKLRKDVLRDLKKFCDGKKPDLLVCVMGWGKGADGVLDLVDAKELVPADRLADDNADPKAWVAYAEKIGVPVYVIAPDKTHREKRVMVSRRQIMDDAAARHEHGMEWDLIPKGVKKPSAEVEKALHALEGDGEADYDEEEPLAPVATPGAADGVKIEQTMDHHAWVDMGQVRKLAMWAISTSADPATAPEYVPQWAKDMAYEGQWGRIDAVVNWVKGLKK